MTASEIAVILAVAVILILIIYFMSAKGEKRRLTLINSEDRHIELDIEIADNPVTRAKGLMGRSSLGEYEGMLFIFNRSGIYSFWMLNTTIPLDAIYLSEDGTVVDIIEMEPCGLNITRCRNYIPEAEAMYVLEVNQGFSRKQKIEVGDSRILLQSFQ